MKTVSLAAWDLYTKPFVQVNDLADVTSVYLSPETSAVPLEIHLSQPPSDEPASGAVGVPNVTNYFNNAGARPVGSVWFLLTPGQCATLPEGFNGPLWVRAAHRPNNSTAVTLRTTYQTLQSRAGVGVVGSTAVTNAAEQTLVRLATMSLVFGYGGRGMVSAAGPAWFAQSLKLPAFALLSDTMQSAAPNAGLTTLGLGSYLIVASSGGQNADIVNPFNMALPGVLLRYSRVRLRVRVQPYGAAAGMRSLPDQVVPKLVVWPHARVGNVLWAASSYLTDEEFYFGATGPGNYDAVGVTPVDAYFDFGSPAEIWENIAGLRNNVFYIASMVNESAYPWLMHAEWIFDMAPAKAGDVSARAVQTQSVALAASEYFSVVLPASFRTRSLFQADYTHVGANFMTSVTFGAVTNASSLTGAMPDYRHMWESGNAFSALGTTALGVSAASPGIRLMFQKPAIGSYGLRWQGPGAATTALGGLRASVGGAP